MDVKVTRMNKFDKAGSKTKAYAVVEVFYEDGSAFQLGGLKVVEGSNGLFIGMPAHSYKDKQGATKWQNDAELNEVMYKVVSEAIISVYETGNGIENATLGIKKAAEPVGAVSSFAPSKNTIAIDTADNDVPF